MPIYEYRCRRCGRKVTVFLRSFAETASPQCDRCGATELARLISQVAVIKSSGESLQMPDFGSLDDVDEDDPKAMTDWMRRVKRELGDEAGGLSDLDLLDAGVRPGESEEEGEVGEEESA
ncbi:MAG: zinc ribbon domain-containing protein [Chloroflexi bacterium]|nr:zinc ribbon domain-containing protein [Chloroflexota bacterium]